MAHRWISRFVGPDRFGALLLLLLAAFVLVPVLADRRFGLIALVILSTSILILALVASGVQRGGVLLGAGMAIGASTASILHTAFIDASPSAWWDGLLAALVAATPVLVLRRVLFHQRITLQTVAGSLAAYLLVGLAFGQLFSCIDATDAQAFSGGTDSNAFMYFSYTTLTTVGYGDVLATTDLARSLAVLEAVIGQVLLVTLVARLVGMLGEERRDPRGALGPQPPAADGPQ